MVAVSLAPIGLAMRDSLTVMGAALAMMLVVNLLLAWRLPAADQVMLPLACVLSGLGLVMIRRLSPAYSLRQLAGIGVGLLLLLVFALAFRDYRLLRRYK